MSAAGGISEGTDSAVVGEVSEAGGISEGVTLSGQSSFPPEESSQNLALLLRACSTSGLPDLARLLDSLVLPGGGEEVKFPSNEES